MGVTSSMYQLAIFQYNQLGDNDTALDQGVDVWAECECGPLQGGYGVLIDSSPADN